MGASFAGSLHSISGFSPQAIFDEGAFIFARFYDFGVHLLSNSKYIHVIDSFVS
jgi:hypothetical protein